MPIHSEKNVVGLYCRFKIRGFYLRVCRHWDEPSINSMNDTAKVFELLKLWTQIILSLEQRMGNPVLYIWFFPLKSRTFCISQKSFSRLVALRCYSSSSSVIETSMEEISISSYKKGSLLMIILLYILL